MNETSPKVPAEPKPLRIPYFRKHTSLLIWASTQPNLKDSICCQCPHVIVADDDPVEIFYYEMVFNKLKLYNQTSFKKEDFRLLTLSSGEELIAHYQKFKACGCGTVSLVFTDYDMGKARLNGVETALALRKADYKGPVILRTSETKEVLTRWHKDLEFVLTSRTITTLLSKFDHGKLKEILQRWTIR